MPGALQRRERQRLARGTKTIDARLDLHGKTQTQAHGSLLRFLHRAQANGATFVLVITGKGSGENAVGRGILRRQVPLWLALPEFAVYVSAFEQAQVSHGGEGALYIRVRKPHRRQTSE
jgi:DNA-nicking Smr family endonuclease